MMNPSSTLRRLPALDWMRGLVMVLMAVDHAGGVVDAGHLMTDSWGLYTPGIPLPVDHFLTRWITHLCAPTFLFLAGTSLALSMEKRQAGGTDARTLDRHLFKRGLVLLAFEMFWVNPFGQQVLFALGMSFICMIPLRRLSNPMLVGGAVLIVVAGEAVVNLAFQITGAVPETLRQSINMLMHMTGDPMEALQNIRNLQSDTGWFSLFMPFVYPGIIWVGPAPMMFLYPFTGWLAMMMLGWGFGRMLTAYQAHPDSAWHPEKVLLVAGGIGLSVFAVLRGLNSYGNMWLLREDHSLVQWLHVSKYPPSITFTALELGLMALCLYVFFRYQRTLTGAPRAWNPLMVFGQTALFFYIFHMHILGLAGFLTGTTGQLGLPGTCLFTLGILALMYPLCVRFRRYKAANPHKWVRYI